MQLALQDRVYDMRLTLNRRWSAKADIELDRASAVLLYRLVTLPPSHIPVNHSTHSLVLLLHTKSASSFPAKLGTGTLPSNSISGLSRSIHSSTV